MENNFYGSAVLSLMDRQEETTRIGGIKLKNQVIGVHYETNTDLSFGFVTTQNLLSLFDKYNNGDENLKSFINGQYVFARPNNHIKTFLFDPTNGEKIDWKLIRKAFNAHFDYIEKNK